MKTRALVYILLIIIFTGLGVYGMLNKPKEYPSDDILGKVYYEYNLETESYEQITIEKSAIAYQGTRMDIQNCSDYSYSKAKETFYICNKEINVVTYTESVLLLRYDETNLYFYIDKEKAYKNEVERVLNDSEENYNSEVENTLSNIEIDMNKFNEFLADTSKHYVYYLPSECSSKCLIVSRNVKELTTNEIHFINELDENTINTLNTIEENITNINVPLVIVINGGTIEKVIKVEIEDINTINGYVDRKEEGLNE